jgi:hypothetical protein
MCVATLTAEVDLGAFEVQAEADIEGYFTVVNVEVERGVASFGVVDDEGMLVVEVAAGVGGEVLACEREQPKVEQVVDCVFQPDLAQNDPVAVHTVRSGRQLLMMATPVLERVELPEKTLGVLLGEQRELQYPWVRLADEAVERRVVR